MYYSKEELERIRKKGEEQLREIESSTKGFRYESSVGIQIDCTHCRHDRFQEGNALLNTRGLTYLNLDWLNKSAVTLICNKCGYIQWFAKDVKRLG